MNKKVGIVIVAVVLVGGVVSLAAYLRHVGGAVIFEPRGPVAYQERKLIYFGLLLSLVVVVPVFTLAAMIAWRYRESNTKAKYTPDWDHSPLAETVWWGIPALLICILSVVAWDSSHTLDPYRPLASPVAPMTIQVVALDWKWLFIYPQDHVATVNFVRLPVNTPVTFQITSDAPMNSFWIPQLGGQIYAMPGMSTQLHLMASSAGNFYGSSANISGRGFADMHFMAQARPAADFYRWVAQTRHASPSLDLDAYHRLATPSVGSPQTAYALTQDDLYNVIIAKYMTPNSMPGMAGMDMQTAGVSN